MVQHEIAKSSIVKLRILLFTQQKLLAPNLKDKITLRELVHLLASLSTSPFFFPFRCPLSLISLSKRET